MNRSALPCSGATSERNGIHGRDPVGEASSPIGSARKTWPAQDRDSGSLLNHYRRLIHLRNEHSALGSGYLTVGWASDGAVAAFMRRSPSETVVVVLNFGARAIPRADVTLTPGRRRYPHAPIRADLRGPAERLFPRDIPPGRTKSVSLGQIAGYGLCVFQLPSR